MIRGVGIDTVETARIAKVWARFPQFVARILTPEERDYCLRKRDPVPHVAGRWAGKEAVMKAVGCPLRWQEVAILPNAHGAPEVHLRGESARRVPVGKLLVSITHTALSAQAVALWVVE